MSPIAQTCGSAVRMKPSTLMTPRSVSTRVVSSPMSSTLAARPAATRRTSAATSRGLPPSTPTVRRTPASSATREATSNSGVRHDLDAAPLERALKLPAHVAVLERDDRGEVLEKRDLHSEVVKQRGELRADRPRPDDGDARRQAGQAEDVVAGEDPDAVRHDPGQALHPAARGEDDVGRLQETLAAGARRAVLAMERHADAARPVEPAPSGDPFDLVLRHQRPDAGPHPLDDRRPCGRRSSRSRGRPPRGRSAPAPSPSPGRDGRRRPTPGAPSSGCSPGGGMSRRSCPRRRGRPSARAGRPGRRPRSRRSPRRARRDRTVGEPMAMGERLAIGCPGEWPEPRW